MCLICTIVCIILAIVGVIVYFTVYHNKSSNTSSVADKKANGFKWLLTAANKSYIDHPFKDFVPESFIMKSIDDDENGKCYNLLTEKTDLDTVEKFCSKNATRRNIYKRDLYLVTPQYYDTFMDLNSTAWDTVNFVPFIKYNSTVRDPIGQNLSNLLSEENNGTCYIFRPKEPNHVDEERPLYSFHPTECGNYLPSICSGVQWGTCAYRELNTKT